MDVDGPAADILDFETIWTSATSAIPSLQYLSIKLYNHDVQVWKRDVNA